MISGNQQLSNKSWFRYLSRILREIKRSESSLQPRKYCTNLREHEEDTPLHLLALSKTISHLKTKTDVTFAMYFQPKHSDWHSPPFFTQNFKMGLIVNPNGSGWWSSPDIPLSPGNMDTSSYTGLFSHPTLSYPIIHNYIYILLPLPISLPILHITNTPQPLLAGIQYFYTCTNAYMKEPRDIV